ncbi:MAG: hypothetical protein BalsKO_24180 [Balneolaceae bacterium]
MYKLFFLLLTVLFLLTGCRDKCDSEPEFNVDQDQLAADIIKIDAFLEGKNIDAEIHPSGIRYEIKREGTGDRPKLCDNIVASFGGNLISNGFEFSPNDGVPVSLGTLDGLIPGWQFGIPLIKQGGRVVLYIPSVYGYGVEGRPDGGIPSNANLEFEILLF